MSQHAIGTEVTLFARMPEMRKPAVGPADGLRFDQVFALDLPKTPAPVAAELERLAPAPEPEGSIADPEDRDAQHDGASHQTTETPGTSEPTGAPDLLPPLSPREQPPDAAAPGRPSAGPDTPDAPDIQAPEAIGPAVEDTASDILPAMAPQPQPRSESPSVVREAAGAPDAPAARPDSNDRPRQQHIPARAAWDSTRDNGGDRSLPKPDVMRHQALPDHPVDDLAASRMIADQAVAPADPPEPVAGGMMASGLATATQMPADSSESGETAPTATAAGAPSAIAAGAAQDDAKPAQPQPVDGTRAARTSPAPGTEAEHRTPPGATQPAASPPAPSAFSPAIVALAQGPAAWVATGEPRAPDSTRGDDRTPAPAPAKATAGQAHVLRPYSGPGHASLTIAQFNATAGFWADPAGDAADRALADLRPAPGEPGAAAAPALAGATFDPATGSTLRPTAAPPAILAEIVRNTPSLPGQVLDIMLRPEELGRLRMVLAMQDGMPVLHVTTERPETLDLIRRHLDHLLEEFRAQGFAGLRVALDDERSAAGDTPDRRGGAQQTPALAELAQPDPAAAVAIRAGQAGLDLRL